MKEKIDKNLNRIIFGTKCAMIILTLLTAVPILNTFGRDIYKLCCLWGGILVLYLFIKNRKNFWTLEYFFLFLFCCSYVVTILLNFSSHFINEVAMLGYTGLLLFTMTYYDRERTTEETKKELIKLSWLIVAVTWFFAFIAIVMFVFSVSGFFKLDGTLYIYGMFENRLWGLYNPNTGSVINYISFILSAILLKFTGKRRKFLWSNLIFQGICFILAQSRGGWICVIGYLVIYLLFLRKWKKEKPHIGAVKKWAYRCFVTLIVCIGVAIGSHVAKVALSYVPYGVATIFQYEDELKDRHEKLERLDKKDNNLESITTGRLGLWKVGLKVYENDPLFGIGYRSIDDALREDLDKGAYLNSHSGGLHNIYITTLVSCGAVGFVLMGAFMLLVLKKMLQVFFRKDTPDYVKYIFTFIPVWLIGELAESRIILGMNFLAVIFWITMGYVMYFTRRKE